MNISFGQIFLNHLPPLALIYIILITIFFLIDRKKEIKRNSAYIIFISITFLFNLIVGLNVLGTIGAVLMVLGIALFIMWLIKVIKSNKKYTKKDNKIYSIIKISILILYTIFIGIYILIIISKSNNVLGHYVYEGKLNTLQYTQYIKLFDNELCEFNSGVYTYTECNYIVRDTLLYLTIENNKGKKIVQTYTFNNDRTTIIDDDDKKIIYVKQYDY